MTLIAALVTALVTTAPPNPKLLVNAGWLNEHRNDANVVVLHVTWDKDEYPKGHIPGAALLFWNDFVVQSETEASELPPVAKLVEAFERVGVSDNSTVIVYGDPLAAGRAFMTLEYLGHRDVRLLDGGLASWRAAGYPVLTDEAVAKPGKLTPKVRSFVVDANWVNEHRTKRKYALIDARPVNEFTGASEQEAGHGGMQHVGGHIPGAQNIYWTRFVKSRAEPAVLPVSELKALFERAGVTDDTTVVVYCAIGMRASFAYFVSRYLGYETKFYDGSWHDWSKRDLPIVKGGEPVK